MTVKPLHDDSRCPTCATGYLDVHNDSCPKSTARPCVVCGQRFDQGTPDGRCLLDDEAHRTFHAEERVAA